MKNAVLLAIMLLSVAASANTSKVFVCVENESFSSTPIHGTTAWTTYIGASKLAFAKGYTYKIRIEYSGILPPGTIGISNASGTISAIERIGNTFSFKLTIPMATERLMTFQIGYKKTSTTITYPISCEVVEIGKLYSMTLQDSTNTTMAGFVPKSTTLVALQFAKQTGKKHFRFYGSNLGNIRFNTSLSGGQAMGLVFNSTSYAMVDNTNFKLTATTGNVSTTGGQLAEHILGRLIDTAADKHYPWVTYKYAKRMDGAVTNESVTNPSGGVISASAISFSLLPGQTVLLPSTTSGYHDFMSAAYTVN
jgi:hypothetical protein